MTGSAIESGTVIFNVTMSRVNFLYTLQTLQGGHCHNQILLLLISTVLSDSLSITSSVTVNL